MTAVFKREFKSYYTGIIGYIFTAVVLLFAGIFSWVINLGSAYSNFEYVLSSMTFVYMIAIPLLTMRAVAEERRQKTDQLLYSLPLGMGRIIAGKYLAMLAVIALPCAVMCLYPLVLSMFGQVYLPSAYGAIVGFFLLGAALAAIGLFISTMTENPAVAAGLGIGVTLLLYFMSALASFVPSSAVASMIALLILVVVLAFLVRLLTKSTVVAFAVGLVGWVGVLAAYLYKSTWFEGLFLTVVQQISLFDRFSNFVDGIFDLTAVVYYISVAGIFVFLSVQAMEKRRWS